MNPTTSKLATLMGSASLLTMTTALAAHAQQVAQAQMAQANPQEVPEQVLITGSLIRGTAAVGVPVTSLSTQDFTMTGANNVGDLFRTIPQANTSPGPVATESGANRERGTRVNLRQLDTGAAARTLLMVDGVRFPPQGNGLCSVEPGIIPAISLERIDVLVDGASATYGSDALGGVINLVLRRNFDGAVTRLRYNAQRAGRTSYAVGQLWGRSWDGGNVTLSYEWYDESPSKGSSIGSKFTTDFSPWGLDNRIPLASSLPGTLSTGGLTSSNALNASLGRSCSNCYAIPPGAGGAFNPINGGVGPTAPFSASTLNWATFNTPGNSGTNGTRNEFNPYTIAWASAAEQTNGGHIAIDQRLTRNIAFFGTGFYTNRRAQYLNPSNLPPANFNDLFAAVPTFNPYYPTGGAPANLRVNYNIGLESPGVTSAFELSGRYQVGLNLTLPGDWTGQVSFSQTYDSNTGIDTRIVNSRAVSAALGWTMPALPGVGTAPAIATWTKPATIPYLNLFCDPLVNRCNSATTLNYIDGFTERRERMTINDKQMTFNGPLFDVPAGQVKAAVGGLIESQAFSYLSLSSILSPSLVFPYVVDTRTRNIWALFTQVNIPVFSETNAIPLFNRLEFEGSWRHDQYAEFGGTSNPKIAFNWTPSVDVGLTVRGSWGTSFRAPSYGEISPPVFAAIACQNMGAIDPSCNAVITTGPIGTPPPVGSGAWKVNPTGAAALNAPAGISLNGVSTAAVAAGMRVPGSTNGAFTVMKPEKSMNWSLGAEFAPTNFLRGLDLQVTWYKIKINDYLSNFGNPATASFTDPNVGFSFLAPSDFAGVPGNANCATANAAPTTCAAFEAAVVGLLSNPRSAVDPTLATRVYWINDGGVFNKGFQRISGIDFTGSYDWDMGDLGAWNTGIAGTYYLKREVQSVPGAPIVGQLYNTTVNNGAGISSGVNTIPQFKYRARLGWSNGPWSVTGFMDYAGHFFHTQAAPPNVNLQCVSAGSSVAGGTFPCAISNYTNILPSQYTFDLSTAYDTGDAPENNYLKHISIQLVVQNILDRRPAFQYRISSAGGNPAAYDILKAYQGRWFSLILTKTW